MVKVPRELENGREEEERKKRETATYVEFLMVDGMTPDDLDRSGFGRALTCDHVEDHRDTIDDPSCRLHHPGRALRLMMRQQAMNSANVAAAAATAAGSQPATRVISGVYRVFMTPQRRRNMIAVLSETA